jgi:hypothetical protein
MPDVDRVISLFGPVYLASICSNVDKRERPDPGRLRLSDRMSHLSGSLLAAHGKLRNSGTTRPLRNPISELEGFFE